ncbi:S-adenosyl-L-methionine-dependent methyltransferase [Mollisia scopiformis]|uniref:S-adenosyl-L-methionine-dependent methyltransferase n=1 Tax=Mollisia scopiformis TaxID=149040 RepID=A0A194WYH6_MOLSC|nr:S-adenosyl-L-methionine-dependent methyltransferase [Mollisia scopiformis]KUJ13013.1 S-adenosyl-L-methionine-dependent methyltransferase [Mollisia scopiformis]
MQLSHGREIHLDLRNSKYRNDTFSVDSSITQYRIENGRRYHAYKDGIYWAPNDDKQNENLDISHHKYLLLLEGNLTAAPIEKDIERVLDIGTGTGIWAIDFADEHPNTTVIGTDLSPIQPDVVPPNLRFEIDDVRDRWTYPVDYFDFIHMRALFGSIDDWDAVYGQVYKHLKPGGYFEQVEISIYIKSDDGSLQEGNPFLKFTRMFEEAGEITGQTFKIAEIMKEKIERAGFVNVVEKVFKAPMGGWPADPKLREIGQWTLLGFLSGLEGYALATLTRVLQWSVDEVHVFLAQVRQAVRDRSLHSYHEIRIVYAQKPQ